MHRNEEVDEEFEDDSFFPGIRNLWSKTPPGDETNLHSEIWADSDFEVDLIKRDSLSKVKYEAKTRLQLQF